MQKRLILLYLDIKSIPTLFLTKELNAKYHLKYLCPKCPQFRKKMRDVKNNKTCWWHENWKNKNYNIPKNFGIKNWVSQYLFLKTNLKKFKNYGNSIGLCHNGKNKK